MAKKEMKVEPAQAMLTGRYGDKVVGVNYKSALSLTNRVQMVYDISNFVFQKGQYQPMLKEYAVRYCVLKYFTDLQIDEEEDAELTWEKLRSTDIYVPLVELLGYELHNILAEADELIEYRKGLMIATIMSETAAPQTTPKVEAMYDLVLEIGDKILLVLDKLQHLNLDTKQMATFLDAAAGRKAD